MRTFVSFTKWYHQWWELLKERSFLISFLASWLFFALALYVNFQSVIYTENVKAVSVGDIILDNIPTIDLLFMYTWGIFLVVAITIIYPVFFKQQ